MENVKDGKLDGAGTHNLSGYLYIICKRMAMRLMNRKPVESGEFRLVIPEDEVEEYIDPDVLSEEDRYARDFLDRVLASLPNDCRMLMKRFYWDHLPMDEIAPLMGLKNANTAKSTKNRCMHKYKSLAEQLMNDDEKAERAVRRSVERAALRDMLDQFRREDEGEIAVAACRSEEDTTDHSS